MSDEIRAKVVEIVCERLGTSPEKLTDETSFTKDLGADSLDLVELVMAFEDNFNMSIPDDATQQIQTIGDTINYIMTHQG